MNVLIYELGIVSQWGSFPVKMTTSTLFAERQFGDEKTAKGAGLKVILEWIEL